MMDRLTGDFKGASMFATVEQAMQYNRLAQYENTGLTPADLAAMTAERDAWRRRAEAAEKDMFGYIDRTIHGISGKYACDLCKSGEADLSCKKKACDGFSEWEWRGPKEGGSE